MGRYALSFLQICGRFARGSQTEEGPSEGIIRALSGIIGGGRLSVCLRASDRAMGFVSFAREWTPPAAAAHGHGSGEGRSEVSADNLSLLCLH